MGEVRVYICPWKKSYYEADDIEEAEKYFKCKDCSDYLLSVCNGAAVKSQEYQEVHAGLTALAKTPRATYGAHKRNAILFFEEIQAARKAGHSWLVIAKTLEKSGYGNSNQANSLKVAFNKLKRDLASLPE